MLARVRVHAATTTSVFRRPAAQHSASSLVPRAWLFGIGGYVCIVLLHRQMAHRQHLEAQNTLRSLCSETLDAVLRRARKTSAMPDKKWWNESTVAVVTGGECLCRSRESVPPAKHHAQHPHTRICDLSTAPAPAPFIPRLMAHNSQQGHWI